MGKSRFGEEQNNKRKNERLRIHTHTHTLAVGTVRVILNDSPSPHILSRENTDVISLPSPSSSSHPYLTIPSLLYS